MYIDKTDPKNEKVLVILNGKWCRDAFYANDEEGWVEILDIASIAPLELGEEEAEKIEVGEDGSINEEDMEEPEFSEVKTKRIFGKVEFIGKPE